MGHIAKRGKKTSLPFLEYNYIIFRVGFVCKYEEWTKFYSCF